jgi:beta-N-acetylhexosaminidase
MIEKLRNLPIRQKIGQLFLIGIAGPAVDEPTRALLEEITPGGVCLFSRNIREAVQTRKLLDDLRAIMGLQPILSLDQEGGTVDRLRRVVTPIAAANHVRSPEEAAEMATLIGETISLLGFNVDFAPVVDVVDEARGASSNGLFSRPFGRSKEDVVALAGEFLQVLQQHGPIGCLKHFPGLGGANVDAHEELPVVTIGRGELFDIDLYPYRKLLAAGDVHAVMVAHASFPAVDLQERDQNGKLLPSSLSANFITTLLRGELNFNGLVITDDLEMGAIVKNYGIGEACVMAVQAGADVLAICADPENVRGGFKAVVDAVESGRITGERIDESIARIAQLKSKLAEPPPFDGGRLSELSDEIAGFNARLDQH